jgi:ribosomal protein S18 acetylase RimI-like enzyme
MSHVIESGQIKKSGTPSGKEVPYDLTFLDERRLTDIMNLQEIIVQNLSDPELFHADSIHFIRDHICKRGRIIGVISEKRLIAYRILAFPGNDPDNLGIDLKLPKKELNKVAHLESFAVHPAYRGNSLQLKTLGPAIRIIRDLNYDHLCATVSTKNYPSLSNPLKGGFVIRELKEKYGGKLRYILYQNLNKPISRNMKCTITVKNTDIARQKKAIKKEEGFEIVYGK